jgi:endonuclease/exonuclease/phosphatase family metal-dependent hydrolase
MHPFTFLACTYNLWGTARWDQRRVPLQRFLEVNRPDVLCVQELTEDSRALIGDTLASWRSVDDPLPGWTREGNIFWNAGLFDLVEYGAEDIGMVEELRRLWWVRLRNAEGRTVVVATAHFSWTGNVRELEDRINLRTGQAEEAIIALNRIVGEDEPVLFMGDFNDYIHPLRVLRMAGYEDSFMGLGREAVATYPAMPFAQAPPEILDWMMHRGPVRPTLTSVVDFHVAEKAPSDHKPILTTYTLVDS